MSSIFPNTVHLGDPKNPEEILFWAKTLKGFQGVSVTDVTDVSYKYDAIYSYSFSTQEEANWFKLRWE